MKFGKISNSEKAMKLKWKKGISLEKAWEIVKKKESKKKQSKKKNKRVAFGDTVCPKDYEPNKNWTGKRGQQICVKECDFYQMRNPETNRCRNMTMMPKMSGSMKTIEIPAEYELGPSGRLRKMCMPGQYRDPVSGRCRKIKPVLQPLIIPTKFGTISQGKGDAFRMKKGPKGHSMPFGKKCGFGSCSTCSIK